MMVEGTVNCVKGNSSAGGGVDEQEDKMGKILLGPAWICIYAPLYLD